MSGENSTPAPRRAFVRTGPRSLATQGQPVAAGVFAARGFANPQIVLRWREFAGPVLGRLTAPLSLSPQGLLTLSADPSVAVFLQHQTAQLIQRVNLAAGQATVSKIKVVSGKFPRAPQPKPKPALSPAQRNWASQAAGGVKDPDLKTALTNLGQAIAAEAPGKSAAPLRPKS